MTPYFQLLYFLAGGGIEPPYFAYGANESPLLYPALPPPMGQRLKRIFEIYTDDVAVLIPYYPCIVKEGF